ncbi:hypothetical protein HPC62_11805 [Thermoleptolyngbya sichuanensis A183]|uniref:Uncharacterized protein n=1 Tax=Thermoleptolyngbya sichuanensis A183 TaxID=2737172 RepID=A0A6M8B8H8_9CYAN|nr:hypothetical protein [Thermoleptolyngbya sichuanensis]QKD82778.1 hypothetical protein HPC62_11805 [Thermoleptolyngbya sichuanensis A183]
MNTQLIDAIIQVIGSLSPEEQAALAEKLFFDCAYPSTSDILTLALRGSSFDFLNFDFLNSEPDLYTLDDGEPIPCL